MGETPRRLSNRPFIFSVAVFLNFENGLFEKTAPLKSRPLAANISLELQCLLQTHLQHWALVSIRLWRFQHVFSSPEGRIRSPYLTQTPFGQNSQPVIVQWQIMQKFHAQTCFITYCAISGRLINVIATGWV